MNHNELSDIELGAVVGGSAAEFIYDLGRAIRFVGLSGGGMLTGNAVVDWLGTSAINQAAAK
ncbi:MAG: hypothetical protein WDM96_14520 [Lacunisphaera sp.]